MTCACFTCAQGEPWRDDVARIGSRDKRESASECSAIGERESNYLCLGIIVEGERARSLHGRGPSAQGSPAADRARNTHAHPAAQHHPMTSRARGGIARCRAARCVSNGWRCASATRVCVCTFVHAHQSRSHCARCLSVHIGARALRKSMSASERSKFDAWCHAIVRQSCVSAQSLPLRLQATTQFVSFQCAFWGVMQQACIDSRAGVSGAEAVYTSSRSVDSAVGALTPPQRSWPGSVHTGPDM